LSFIIQAIVYSILFFISVYSFVFTNKEKEFLKRMLKIN
jgi:hypothetical protein